MKLENILLDKYIIFSDCSKLPTADLETMCPPSLLVTISLWERVRSWTGQVKSLGPGCLFEKFGQCLTSDLPRAINGENGTTREVGSLSSTFVRSLWSFQAPHPWAFSKTPQTS